VDLSILFAGCFMNMGKSSMVAKHCRTLANDGAILLNVVGIAFWSSNGLPEFGG